MFDSKELSISVGIWKKMAPFIAQLNQGTENQAWVIDQGWGNKLFFGCWIWQLFTIIYYPIYLFTFTCLRNYWCTYHFLKIMFKSAIHWTTFIFDKYLWKSENVPNGERYKESCITPFSNVTVINFPPHSWMPIHISMLYKVINWSPSIKVYNTEWVNFLSILISTSDIGHY